MQIFKLAIFAILLTLLPSSKGQASNSEDEVCTFLESTVNYHVSSIPFLLDKAIRKAKKELSFSVFKARSYGVAVFGAVAMDLVRDWYTFNRTLGNLYGTDTRKIRGHHKNMLLIGATGGDGVAYQLIINSYPEDIDKCPSRPEDFLSSLDYWQVLSPEKFSAEDAILNYTGFTSLAASNLACLFNFQDSFIEVAKVRWALQQLFSALELRLVGCVLSNDNNAIKLRRIKRSQPAFGSRR